MKLLFRLSWLFIFLFSWNGHLLVAQNLIIDPGFEIWDGTIHPNPNTLGALTHWYNSSGTSDHHHQLNPPGSNLTSLEDCPTGQGQTECGMPYEGQGVLGCWKGNGPDGSREWAGTKLSEPMIAGACYEVSFWIQNKEDEPGNEFVINQWGMLFDHDEIPFFNPSLANYAAMTDQWVGSEEVIEGSDWIKLEFDYQASEDFEYAHIGFMGDFSTATYSVANEDVLFGYYVWIDEVIITQIDPSQLTLTDDVIICKGESVTLEAISDVPINWEDNDSGESSRTLSPDSTTTYYVQTLDGTPCSVRDSIVVTVLGAEIFDFDDISICTGADPLKLDSKIDGGIWVGPGIIDAVQGIFDPMLAGTGEFLIEYISDSDCSESFTMRVQVNPAPELDFEADVLQGCSPLEVQFSNLSITGGIEYQWDLGNGTTSNESLMASTVYTEEGEYDVSLEVVFSENCKNRLSFPDFVQVFESPEAGFSYNPTTPSNLSPEVQMNNTSKGNITSVLWNFGNGSTSDSFNPSTDFDLPGIYDVKLWVSTANGCVDSITQQIAVKSVVNIYLPNVFSPNGDGINDLFEIHAFGPILEYEITIYDRWGDVQYQSDDINDSWNGSFSSGNKCSEGVYAYLIKYSYQGSKDDLIIEEQKVGDVTIMR